MEAEQLQEAAAAAAEPPVQKDAGQHSDDMEQTKGETAPETDDGSEMLAEDDGEEGVDWDLLLDTSKYRHVKRTPLRPPTRQCDIYCTTSRQQRVLLKRAYRLLVEERLPFVVLHGLGAAVPVAIDLALQLRGELDANHSSLHQRAPPLTEELIRRANAEQQTDSQSSASSSASLPLSQSPFARSFFTTSTVTGTEVLIDDYEPLVAGLQPVSQRRQNSSIHITVTVSAEADSELLLGRRPRSAAAAAVGSSAGGRQPSAYRGRGRGEGGGRGSGGRSAARGGAGRGRGAGGAGGSSLSAQHGRDSRPTAPSSQPWKKQKR